jgi:DNA-directed RNA polymerase subunit RPC12/RpoP
MNSEITGEPLRNREYMKNGVCVSEPWPDSGNYSDPTPEMLADPLWNAVWEEIKHWDINVPSRYNGYMNATGNHATAIFKAIKAGAVMSDQPASPAPDSSRCARPLQRITAPIGNPAPEGAREKIRSSALDEICQECGHNFSLASRVTADLRAQLAEWEERWDKASRNVVCAYCGHLTEVDIRDDKARLDAMLAHSEVCEKSPVKHMLAAMERAETAEAQLAAQQREIERLREVVKYECTQKIAGIDECLLLTDKLEAAERALREIESETYDPQAALKARAALEPRPTGPSGLDATESKG